MVLPAQNIPVSPINSELPAPNVPNPEGAPESREEVTDLFTPTLNTQTPTPQVERQGSETKEQPEPRKVVDLITKKVTDTPIETPDKITSLADDDEREFREGVDGTAHEQHS